jgi:hypothetical protein
LTWGTEEEIDTKLHCSSPTGENKPIFIKVKMKSAPNEKSLKNQLLLNVFASYFATVLMLLRNGMTVIVVSQLYQRVICAP